MAASARLSEDDVVVVDEGDDLNDEEEFDSYDVSAEALDETDRAAATCSSEESVADCEGQADPFDRLVASWSASRSEAGEEVGAPSARSPAEQYGVFSSRSRARCRSLSATPQVHSCLREFPVLRRA